MANSSERRLSTRLVNYIAIVVPRDREFSKLYLFLPALLSNSQRAELQSRSCVDAVTDDRLARCALRAWPGNGQLSSTVSLKHFCDLQFCEPAGWRIYARPFRPRLHATVLTDAAGEQHQCIILTLPQPVAPLPPARKSITFNLTILVALFTAHQRKSELRDSLSGECNGGTTTGGGYEPLCIVAVSKHPLVDALKVLFDRINQR